MKNTNVEQTGSLTRLNIRKVVGFGLGVPPSPILPQLGTGIYCFQEIIFCKIIVDERKAIIIAISAKMLGLHGL